MSKKNVMRVITACTLAITSLAVFAAPARNTSPAPSDSGFYAGGTIGATQLDDDNMGRYQDQDTSGGAFNVYGGYQFNKYLASEVTLHWLGSYEGQTVSSDIWSDYSAFTLTMLGKLPLGGGFSLYGQAGGGVASIYQDIWVALPGGLYDDSDSDSALAKVFGAGLLYIPPQLPFMEFRAGYMQTDFRIRAYAVDGAGNLTRDHYNQRIEQFMLGAAYRF